MTHGPTLELTVRGVSLSDETLGYLRRCADRLPGRLEFHTWALLERRTSGTVRATVAVLDHRGPVVMSHEDPDELLALSSAFARLADELSLRAAPTRAVPRERSIRFGDVADSGH